MDVLRKVGYVDEYYEEIEGYVGEYHMKNEACMCFFYDKTLSG